MMETALIVIGAIYSIVLILLLFAATVEYKGSRRLEDRQYYARMMVQSPFWPVMAYCTISKFIGRVVVDANRSDA